ncbi:MAG: D-glycero-beta-D-manno-heptose 1-phosphate adenylyltransferase [bacterium]
MQEKIKTLPELLSIRERLRAEGKRVVFTNGCFDLLHIGHIRYLAEAKSQGDVLFVGVNSDSSVRKLKGDKRPLVKDVERAELLAALAACDYVTIFDELTPESLIRALQPDVHVKGGDYRKEDLPEAEIVENYGGEVVLVNLILDHSTTDLIKVILERYS